MKLELKELTELRKLPIAAEVGILVGAILYPWIYKKGWNFDLAQVCSAFALLSVFLWRHIDLFLVQPFIKPILRAREMLRRLRECLELQKNKHQKIVLSPKHWQEIAQKIILDYFLPSKKSEKED